MATTSPPRRPDATGRGTFTAVAPVLLPPLAWTAALAVSYVIEDFTCTAAASAGAPAPATTVRVILLALNAVLLLVTLAAGAVSWRALRRWRGVEGARLQAFLGAVGVALALLFGFGIVLIGANPLVLEVCR